MTRSTLLAIITALAVASGCGSDSGLPEATGEGTVRMINAIPTAPEIRFLIEERALDTVDYKANSAPETWDDLAYTFHFEARPPLQSGSARFASLPLDLAPDIEHTLVVRGSLEAPAVDVWEIPERSFSDAGTVFEMRIGQAAEALGTVDVYLGLESAAPDIGNLVATLAPGEVSAPTDVEQDTYIVTVTPAGNSTDVLFQSVPTPIGASQSVLITVFEGDANDTAPVTARVLNERGLSSVLADARFPPTARFIHATMDLGTSDIYDDAALQNRIVADLAFGDVTGNIDMAVGETTITATAPGNVGAIQLEDNLTAFAGLRLNYYFTVFEGELEGVPVLVDRRSIETIARLTFFHSASNHEFIDLYVVEAGTAIDDALPRQFGVSYGLQTPSIQLSAGSYEIYITTAGEKTVLDGPIALEAALGDVFQAVLLDRVDPSLAEFRLFPPP